MKLFAHLVVRGALALLLGGGATASAQDGEQVIQCEKVPAAVRSAFATTYPKATIKSCKSEVDDDNTVYEILSVEGDTGRDVSYDEDGKVIVVEETIATGNLPKPVQQAAAKNTPEGKIILAEKLTRGSSVTYELRIEHKGKTVEIVFDADGNEVKP